MLDFDIKFLINKDIPLAYLFISLLDINSKFLHIIRLYFNDFVKLIYKWKVVIYKKNMILKKLRSNI